MKRWLLPAGVIIAFLTSWHFWVVLRGDDLVPTPWEATLALHDLYMRGLLWPHIVASLYRVSWGFSLAVILGIPLGLLMGWYAHVYAALNPLLQILRPISPIAWMPLAILWFGVTDGAPIFLIFLSSVFPITLTAAAAVSNIEPVYLRAGRNFGLNTAQLLWRVILPAALPQLVTGLRVALGIAWVVVVAAEMIAVRSGLGWLILDGRNAGKRYDLVVAAMFLIGAIGLGLDLVMRRLEQWDRVRWGVHR